MNRAHLDSIHADPIIAHAAVRAALSSAAPRRERFRLCAESLVQHLDAAAVRIWLVANGSRTLVLHASAGPDSWRHRLPVASTALSHIFESGTPYVAQDVTSDPQLKGLDWPPGSRMAYAGYPLRARARAIGVLAMFSHAPIGPESLETLRSTAGMIARTVQPQLRQTIGGSHAPVSDGQHIDLLLGAVRELIGRRRFALEQAAGLQVLRERYALLSRRERQVMTLVVGGVLNKQVGDQLGISEITVKAHRGHVMRKMRAHSLADLVKIAVLLQLTSWG